MQVTLDNESLARNMIRRVDREINSKDKRISETDFRTRAMQPDITAAELRLILMDDLGTGNVEVSVILECYNLY